MTLPRFIPVIKSRLARYLGRSAVLTNAFAGHNYDPIDITRRLFVLMSYQPSMMMRIWWQVFAAAIIFVATPSATETSYGVRRTIGWNIKQLGSFATGQLSSVSCTAIDTNGNRHEMYFSDGSPMTVRRLRRGPLTPEKRA